MGREGDEDEDGREECADGEHRILHSEGTGEQTEIRTTGGAECGPRRRIGKTFVRSLWSEDNWTKGPLMHKDEGEGSRALEDNRLAVKRERQFAEMGASMARC